MSLVVLLRGANVGGNRVFRPAQFIKELEPLGAVNIGAAGTFVIRKRVAESRVRKELANRLPFNAEIFVASDAEVRELMAGEYFAGYPPAAEMTRYVTLMGRESEAAQVPDVAPVAGPWLIKVVARHGRFVVSVARRSPDTPKALGTFDKSFKTPVTTRNWNTYEKILRVLDTP